MQNNDNGIWGRSSESGGKTYRIVGVPNAPEFETWLIHNNINYKTLRLYTPFTLARKVFIYGINDLTQNTVALPQEPDFLITLGAIGAHDNRPVLNMDNAYLVQCSKEDVDNSFIALHRPDLDVYWKVEVRDA